MRIHALYFEHVPLHAQTMRNTYLFYYKNDAEARACSLTHPRLQKGFVESV